MKTIIFNNQEFKQYKDSIYYINKNGDVYSSYSNIILKQLSRKTGRKEYKYIDVRNPITHKQQHVAIHRMVAEVWIRPLKEKEQVNHINDDSLDNRVENLSIGSQKDNINDCYRNGHKISSIKYIIVKDRTCNKILTFCPLMNFIKYDGHITKNGSIKRWLTRQWFNKRYEVIEYGNVKDLEHFRSVTTMGDECTPVGMSLSHIEAHSTIKNSEEIV